jgi:hypothetical protein
MVQQAAWFEGKAEVENEILGKESATEAHSGRLNKAREPTRRAVASAESSQNKELAAFGRQMRRSGKRCLAIMTRRGSASVQH